MKKKREELFDSFSEIDGKLMEEAYKVDDAEKLRSYAKEKKEAPITKIHRSRVLGRVAMAAACLALAVSLVLTGDIFSNFFSDITDILERPTETMPGRAPCEDIEGIVSLSLMSEISSNSVGKRDADDKFIKSQMTFAINLFKAVVSESEDKNENILISPLSIQLALAMAANGADGHTLSEMEKVIGGNISLKRMNEYLNTYTTYLHTSEKCKLKIANSIWFRDDKNRLTVNKDFLQTNADYYGAAAYKSAFDDRTVNDINQWVSHNTDGMIDRIVDYVTDDAIMYLINTLMFDAEWDVQYDKCFVKDGEFFASNGTIQKVSMMSSIEAKCFATENATGFFKKYEGGRYSFVGILPSEVLTLDEYIRELDPEELLEAMNTENGVHARAKLPKFSCEYDTVLNDPLKSLGMSSAFNSFTANFSKLGRSSFGGIYINEVRHKTSIDINEVGTRAGAVTSIGYFDGSSLITTIIPITLDRPFLYMIVDNSTNLPIFIGTVNGIE